MINEKHFGSLEVPVSAENRSFQVQLHMDGNGCVNQEFKRNTPVYLPNRLPRFYISKARMSKINQQTKRSRVRCFMKPLRTHYCIVGLLSLFFAFPLSAQNGGSSGSQGGTSSQSGGSGASGRSTGTGQPSPSQTPQIQGPAYVRGRVVMNMGQPVPEPVSVGLNCGTQPGQAIYTDAKGYFEFALGAGPQGNNMDISASNSAPRLGRGADASLPGGFGGRGGTSFPGSGLMGCELRVLGCGLRTAYQAT